MIFSYKLNNLIYERIICDYEGNLTFSSAMEMYLKHVILVLYVVPTW